METDGDEMEIFFTVMNTAIYPSAPKKWTVEGIYPLETVGYL